MIKRKNYDILPEPYEEDYIVWFWEIYKQPSDQNGVIRVKYSCV